ncbi:hypothetical protein SODG_005450 [Sodalis praecaptivus]
MWYQQTLTLKAQPRGFHLVTDEIVSQLTSLSAVRSGLLHLLLQHTSASLTLNENCDPTVRTDMENHFLRQVPESAPTSTIMKGRMTCRHISNLLCLAPHCYCPSVMARCCWALGREFGWVSIVIAAAADVSSPHCRGNNLWINRRC